MGLIEKPCRAQGKVRWRCLYWLSRRLAIDGRMRVDAKDTGAVSAIVNKYKTVIYLDGIYIFVRSAYIARRIYLRFIELALLFTLRSIYFPPVRS